MKTSSKYFLYGFCPEIILHMALLPLWYKDGTQATLIESSINVILFPIYFTILNIFLVRQTKAQLYIQSFLPVASVILGLILHYINWSIISHDGFNPDQETLIVMGYETVGSLIMSIPGMVIVLFLIRKHKKA